jgi:hypothetical protein
MGKYASIKVVINRRLFTEHNYTVQADLQWTRGLISDIINKCIIDSICFYKNSLIKSSVSQENKKNFIYKTSHQPHCV